MPNEVRPPLICPQCAARRDEHMREIEEYCKLACKLAAVAIIISIFSLAF